MMPDEQQQMTHSQGCAGWGNYNSEHLCTCDTLLPKHLFAIAELFKSSNWHSQANAVRDAGILIEQLTALIKGHIRACLNDGDAEIPYHCMGRILASIEEKFDAGIDAAARVAELESEMHLAGSDIDMAQGPCPGGCRHQTQGARYCLTCLQKKTVAERDKLEQFLAESRRMLNRSHDEAHRKAAELRKDAEAYYGQ